MIALAACQPSSSTNLSSARRFVVIGAPSSGQIGTSEESMRKETCFPSGTKMSPSDVNDQPSERSIASMISRLSYVFAAVTPLGSLLWNKP